MVIFNFLYKNGIEKRILKIIADPNIHQNAPNFRESMPPNPPSKARRLALRDTSRKRGVYFTPIFACSPENVFFLNCAMWCVWCIFGSAIIFKILF